MKSNLKTALSCLAIVALTGGGASAELTIDHPWMDGAVIQRGQSVVLSGRTDSASARLRFGGNVYEAAVDAGRWTVELPPLTARAGDGLTIEAGGEELRLEDVAVGDVMFCSGQSNMAWPVSRSTGRPDAELSTSADIRLLNVPLRHHAAEQAELPTGTRWQRASPEAVEAFSAVCWYTAERVMADGVPLGLVQAAWGGSQIEAWVPRDLLAELGGYETEIGLIETYRDNEAAAQRAFGAQWEAAWEENGARPWADGDFAERAVPEGEMRDWKTYGDPDADRHLGHVWFTKTVVLSKAEAEEAETIGIGLVDDIDATWVNGMFLGSTFSWSDQRRYELPDGLLTEGENVVTVNVLNGYGQGGLLGPSKDMTIELAGGEAVPIADGWSYEIVPAAPSAVPQPPWSSVTGFSTIHNAMVAPLGTLKASKAIWYQGESNTDHPETYQGLMSALVSSWKARFGPDLQTVIVQLPGFGQTLSEPSESGWAAVREAQRKAALADENTALAVTIDAGDATDIHPPNKVVVADRVSAAFEAMRTGSSGGDGHGPTTPATRTRDDVVVHLPAGSYEVKSGPSPMALELCNEGGRCRWADGKLEGSTLILKAGNRQSASKVRYCWSDAPLCNLYRADGIPVSPFQVDIAKQR
ncbi:sialate O-acetylesterase [Parvularcula maris]|uniref:Beta galactosidase jelly roll domain-containing protein n=1 Tax=Parvularcula maris TaxID=2965077 RepID=A0A9X2RIK0_9PROT|nr:sialate O-acetylesterase [Parvularcula maris]MCQ8186089.1 beta galactosidase jelly roll domain-containing protein [Parvularcula maris]